MMPVPLTTAQRSSFHASPELILAAWIVRDAAEAVSEQHSLSYDTSRFVFLADRLGDMLRSVQVVRSRLLRISPALTERSGRNRTLIEMIEAHPGDDEARLRLARLLLRALVWRPETLPRPGESARG